MTLFQVRTGRGAFFAPDDYSRDRKVANPSDPEDHPGGSLVDFKVADLELTFVKF